MQFCNHAGETLLAEWNQYSSPHHRLQALRNAVGEQNIQGDRQCDIAELGHKPTPRVLVAGADFDRNIEGERRGGRALE